MALDDINVPKSSLGLVEVIASTSKQTFVYDGTEVIKTGRTASKTLGSGKKDKVVEITPVQAFTGTWKKWVSEVALYEIES